MTHWLTTCPFCGVGCGLYLETTGNQVVGVYPSVSHPTNRGRICVRGWHVDEVAGSPDRLKHPLLKKNGAFQEVAWDEALEFVVRRLHEIRGAHGPDAIAFLGSPRCSNEEAYLLQKFARTVIGTNNVDHGIGSDSTNSIEVLLEMIGVPASTNSIGELSESDCILVDGIDLARRMPTVGGVVIRAKVNGAKLIAIGTRRHRVAENADIFVQIRPGTEALLYGAMAKVIEDRGLANHAFIKGRCRGYQAFQEQVRDYDLLHVAEACGTSADLIEAAALAYAGAKTAACLYSTSVAERSRDDLRSLINLVLLTGNLGRRGAGIFALSEQNNLQGICDMGMLPHRLPGYKPAAGKAGLTARETLNDGGNRKVKALFLCRHDPVSSASLRDVSTALDQFDLLVVQHQFMTDSAQHADVVLPLPAFGEERATFTSTERRIQLAEQVTAAPEGALPGWLQLTQIAQKMSADWHYQSSAEVMDEIGEAVSFYGGAAYDSLARDYGRQWPCSKDRPLGTPFLFGENSGTFQFVAVPKPASLPKTSPEFPLTLVFGNSLYYWNQNVLIRHSETLKREYGILWLDYPNGFVEVNDEDARCAGIRDGLKVRLCTAGASAMATARITKEVMAGTIYVPYFMHDVEKQIGNGGALVPVRLEKAA